MNEPFDPHPARPARAPLPEGNFIVRIFSDLNRSFPLAVLLLKRSWAPALLSLLALILFAFIAFIVQGCCGITFLLGGWSFASALLHVGPLTAFGRAVTGDTPATRPLLRLARRKFVITFLSFAPQSVTFAVFFYLYFFVLMRFTMRGYEDLESAAWAVVPGVAIAVVLTWLWLRVVLMWLFLAPVVSIAEDPIGIGESFRRAGELSKGRLGFLLIARFVPDAVVLATLPQWSGLAQFERGFAYRNAIFVIMPIVGIVLSAYVSGLLTAAAYGVATGARVPGYDED